MASGFALKICVLKIRAADAKEVGVGNPAEETCCYPNKINVTFPQLFVNKLSFHKPLLLRRAPISWLYAADFSNKVHSWSRWNHSICSKISPPTNCRFCV